MKKIMTTFGAILFASLILISGAITTNESKVDYQQANNNNRSSVMYDSFTDSRDGNVYKTVKIGHQVWMAENLRYLPSVVGPRKGSITTPYYYVYDYGWYFGKNVTAAKATSNYTTYCVLYNWQAACSSCPSGWHLPTEDEWRALIKYLGGEKIAGGKLKATGTIETGTGLWNSPNTGATNETGFTALPGGWRGDDVRFHNIGRSGYWWSTMEGKGSDCAYFFSMLYIDSYAITCHSQKKMNGLSVRCVKD